MYDTDERGRMLWSALDPHEKKLAKLSLWTAVPPLGLLVVPTAQDGFAFGQWLRFGPGASDGEARFAEALTTSPWFSAFVLFAIASAVVSGVAWWRFSRKQDELFHRIQNYVLGRTAAVGLALIFLFWALSLPGWVDKFPLEGVVMMEVILLAVFSADAYRRWR